MAILSTLFNFGKGVGCYFIEAVNIAMNPSKPIPKTNTHPRMPAWPLTPTEYLRMFPYRHYWKYQPMVRSIIFSCFLLYPVFFMSPLYAPVSQAKSKQLGETVHHGEASYIFGRTQRREDAKYFKEYDPKAKLRPHFFKDEISWSKLNYYPHGYSSDH
ncbi:hypothetical protein Mgra_00000383 [Meloidogyne graminicola]|uniref:Uncharacterized protein n=1 Tax=Meloidogyne graminicola TaxID=189291 RepID=A0A8T0A2Z8_9BILA|nr:hypothetical protein Mgra_00000383 [Meloidogyne graminicola]